MNTINWKILPEDLTEGDWKLFKDLPQKEILKTINAAADKMQYLSAHPHNNDLSIQQKEALFNSYEKSRMDLLADIATSTPTMESSKLLFSELIAGIDGNRILLDNISGIEKFKYTIDLYDCRDFSLTGERIKLGTENDFAVAIPNDIIGQHAFYIIVENIIRNTAKHSPKQEKDFLTFCIEVHEPAAAVRQEFPLMNSYYEIHIYDDVKYVWEEKDFTDADKKFFENGKVFHLAHPRTGEVSDVRDINRMDALVKIVRKQNIFINSDLLDVRDNSLRQGAWGMIEMEAAAAYLRKVPVEKIDDDQYTLDINDVEAAVYGVANADYRAANILKAFVKERNDKRHLAYRFFLLKPKEVLLVVDDPGITALLGSSSNKTGLTALATELLKQGIWMVYSGFRKDVGIELFSKDKAYEHELLADMTRVISNGLGLLPDRKVELSPSDFPAVKSKDELIRFKDWLWTRYREQLPGIFIHNHRHNADHTYIFEVGEQYELQADFDHHGTKWAKNFPAFPVDKQYLEITTGISNLSDVLKRSAEVITEGEANRDESIFSKLLSSIYHQAIVLDERIQEAAYSINYHPEATRLCPDPPPVPFYQLYLGTGIFVPSPDEFNLSRISYGADDSTVDVAQQVKQVLENSARVTLKNGNVAEFNRVKFLVIHLGVLEKILTADGSRTGSTSTEKDDIADLVNELLSAWPLPLRKKIKPVIISGRGLPANLPSGISFVNYSALAQYLIDNRNKYLLTELLFSTRKITLKHV
jgi:hypothetical protein